LPKLKQLNKRIWLVGTAENWIKKAATDIVKCVQLKYNEKEDVYNGIEIGCYVLSNT